MVSIVLGIAVVSSVVYFINQVQQAEVLQVLRARYIAIVGDRCTNITLLMTVGRRSIYENYTCSIVLVEIANSSTTLFLNDTCSVVDASIPEGSPTMLLRCIYNLSSGTAIDILRRRGYIVGYANCSSTNGRIAIAVFRAEGMVYGAS